MKTAAFVDGNWLLHQAYFTAGKNSALPEKKVPLRVLDSVCKFMLKLNAGFGCLCFDGPNNFRYKIYPEYKANRGSGSRGSEDYTEEDLMQSSSKEEIYRHLNPTKDLFRMLGFPVCQLETFEADDLLSAGSHHFAQLSEGHEAWMVCRDKDSFQDVRSRVKILWPEQGTDPERLIDKEWVVANHRLTPIQFGDYQVLIGDGVDNVDGVLSPAKSKKILIEHGSLKKFFKTEDGRKFFYEHEQKLRRNKKLVSMDKTCWYPEERELSLKDVHDSRTVFQEYGKLPNSFYQLMSASKPRQSLF